MLVQTKNGLRYLNHEVLPQQHEEMIFRTMFLSDER